MTTAPTLPDGIVAIVKRDCPTCVLVEPVLADLAGRTDLTVYVQDDPSFPAGVDAIHDGDLAVSVLDAGEEHAAIGQLQRLCDGQRAEQGHRQQGGEYGL